VFSEPFPPSLSSKYLSLTRSQTVHCYCVRTFIRKKTGKPPKIPKNDEKDEEKRAWDAELRRRKRLLESKRISGQYCVLKNQLAELETNKRRLERLLEFVEGGAKKRPRGAEQKYTTGQ